MNNQRVREDLWKATAEAVRVSNVVPFRPDTTPCPGDTFVLPETADYPLEWAIVERDPEDVRRLFVVPVDAYPQIGSHDVGLRLDEPGKTANLRCDVGAWLEASRFDMKLHTGALPPDGLAVVRDKREAMASGKLSASLLEEQVDGDPEYQGWKTGTLRLAAAALEKDVPFRKRRVRPQVYAVAASIALLIGASWLHRQTQRFQDELNAKDATVREMEQRLEASGREGDELRQEVASLSEASDVNARRIEQLRRQLEVAPENGDLPVTFLKGARIRSGERRVSIPEGRERIALVVEVVEATPYARYRLRIVDHETDEVAWTSPELPRRGSVVSLSLPSAAFVGGYYDLFLYGFDDELVTSNMLLIN